jgi:2-dehydro-3-deoxyphosphogluconate aldolase / (4S)-4-hydroxy-2-oxoglutarate aldolase
MTTEELLDLATVIPVVVLGDAGEAVPLARRLVAEDMRVIEITLRTPAALDAIAAIAAEVPDAIVGAGTVVSPAQARDAISAGAAFLVSPGATPGLLDALAGLPLLPGAATASEVMALLERGITNAKFFPAEASGGVAALKALHGPFPQMRFCPTGGIDAAKAQDYLALPNVACVGGTWMLKPPAGAAGGLERAATAPSSTA